MTDTKIRTDQQSSRHLHRGAWVEPSTSGMIDVIDVIDSATEQVCLTVAEAQQPNI